MKTGLTIAAIVVLVIGVISTLDGVSVFQIHALGTHHLRWIALGILLLIVGIILFIVAGRKRSETT